MEYYELNCINGVKQVEKETKRFIEEAASSLQTSMKWLVKSKHMHMKQLVEVAKMKEAKKSDKGDNGDKGE